MPPRMPDHWSQGREGVRKEKALNDLLERTSKGFCQSDGRWNCFKGNVGETFDREGFLQCIDAMLN